MALDDGCGPLGGRGWRAFGGRRYDHNAGVRMIGVHWDAAVSVTRFGRRRRGLLGVGRDGGRRVTVRR